MLYLNKKPLQTSLFSAQQGQQVGHKAPNNMPTTPTLSQFSSAGPSADGWMSKGVKEISSASSNASAVVSLTHRTSIQKEYKR